MTGYPDLHLYINGAWHQTGQTLPVLNPADETVIGALPVAGRDMLDVALDVATDGVSLWRRTAPPDRAAIMLRAAALLRSRVEAIARSITLEHGKPLAEARLEVIRGAEFIEWDAGEGQRLYGRTIPGGPGLRYATYQQPVGTIAAFSPWNFPLSQPARKIGGALAAGCSIILKAAGETPAGALHIAHAFHDAGLPPGVLNLVFGVPADISDHLIAHHQTRMVAFTGSTAVGRHLMGLAARHVKPVLMELGGHAPVIVCDDVDAAVAGTLCAIRKVRNAGQVCTSPTRFFVQDAVFDAFVAAFVNAAKAIVVGNGTDPATGMGPLANHRRVETLQALSDDAVARGARLMTGGHRIGQRGYFFAPTVLTEAPADARVMHEEPFGPIAVINRIGSVDEGIQAANALSFGLAAYGLTHSAANVDRMLDGIEAANLSINPLEASVPETPFGGVKSSGYGREGGAEGLLHYITVKTLSHRMTLGPAP